MLRLFILMNVYAKYWWIYPLIHLHLLYTTHTMSRIFTKIEKTLIKTTSIMKKPKKIVFFSVLVIFLSLIWWYCSYCIQFGHWQKNISDIWMHNKYSYWSIWHTVHSTIVTKNWCSCSTFACNYFLDVCNHEIYK